MPASKKDHDWWAHFAAIICVVIFIIGAMILSYAFHHGNMTKLVAGWLMGIGFVAFIAVSVIEDW